MCRNARDRQTRRQAKTDRVQSFPKVSDFGVRRLDVAFDDAAQRIVLNNTINRDFTCDAPDAPS
jgi:hypothetical protein